ncbi:site-specific DNA-methyltransferase [Acrocarpospora sp. B8E8]|uniref:DNA-methyltransferase n=1 Tax=Acrocarpospora sp. B8E8 TaxID=3153572 RepID=UPI00325F5427
MSRLALPVPYYADDQVALYLGDMREVIPALGLQADLICADPPYQETSLPWDRWPDGWLKVAADVSRSMWCFGSQRMFFAHLHEFQSAGWRLSQDIVSRDDDGQPAIGDVCVIWEKNNGSGRQADRFRRIHEHVLHWYRGGGWRDEIYHEAIRHIPPGGVKSRTKPGEIVRKNPNDIPHAGAYRAVDWTDDGTRLMTSVISARSMRGKAIHPTEKPVELLTPLISYACPPGGLVLDPFAGSGSTLEAARLSGRRAIGIEAHEPYAEKAARRLAQAPLELA